MKKGISLPIHILLIIVIGIIVLALILLYIFGVIGEGKGMLSVIFQTGGNITNNTTERVSGFFG